MDKVKKVQKNKVKALEVRIKLLEINMEILKILAGKYATENNIKIETLKSGIIVISEQVKK